MPSRIMPNWAADSSIPAAMASGKWYPHKEFMRGMARDRLSVTIGSWRTNSSFTCTRR